MTHGERPALAPRALRLAAILLPAGLYLASAALRIAERPVELHFQHWRAQDDLALAVGYAARGQFPVAPYRVRDLVRRQRDPRFVAFDARLREVLQREGLRPLEFWRTVAPQQLSLDGTWRLGRRLDDMGRPFLMGLAYRLAGGVSPYLVAWIGVFATVPLLLWVALESAAAGRLASGVVFGLAFGVSAFLLDMGMLGYSPAAFHVFGLLVVLALAYYGALGAVTPRGLLLRCAAAGLLLAGATFCRGTALTFAPAAALAVAAGVRRLAAREAWPRARASAWLAGLWLVCLAPCLVVNPLSQGVVRRASRAYLREEVPRYHDMSLLIWKGMGDFDRSKGYKFWDVAGQQAVRAASPKGFFDREGELQLRRVIWNDIASDPAWYAAILGKRLLASVLLTKLWSYGPRDGSSIVKATTENEGVIDGYYALSRQADWVAFGASERELPTFVLLLPSALALLLASAAAVSARWRAPWQRVRAVWFPALCLSLAVLPVPLLITTATAFEPQCFVLVHFLVLGFLAEALPFKRAAAAPAGSRP